ncbi:hypothetical protein Q5692_11260 [Microcoleus sp. C2C3]|uniref:hypothetical protein n=1 Tax=unclassified Microcoleus TaxID=2642155 RepID=UPI002FD1251D
MPSHTLGRSLTRATVVPEFVTKHPEFVPQELIWYFDEREPIASVIHQSGAYLRQLLRLLRSELFGI